MFPTTPIIASLQTALATDTTFLAAATALHAHLIIAPFTPSAETDLAGLTPATFTGSTPKAAGTGAQQAFTDPISGRRVVQILEPAGGWHWEATAADDLPQTVYGVVLTNTADDETYGSALLDDPVTISAIDDAVDIPQLRFEFQPPTLV